MSNDATGSSNPPLNLAEFLRLLLGDLNSQVGAVWAGAQGQLNLICQQGLDECGLFSGVDGKQYLAKILGETLSQKRSLTFDLKRPDEPEGASSATAFIVPVFFPDASHGVVFVTDRPNLPQQQRQGVLRHIESRLQQLLNHLATIQGQPAPAGTGPQNVPVAPPNSPPVSVGPVPSGASPVGSPATPVVQESLIATPAQAAAARGAAAPPPPASRTSVDSKEVLEYVLSLQRSLDLNEVANVVVNDGRILFGVDRVSLAIRNGNKTVIRAVSGQESVHPRGNLIRAMRILTHKVIESNEPFRYDGSIGNIPKQLEEPLAEFIQESGTRFLLIVPLREPERLVKPEEPLGGRGPKQEERPIIGALLVEQMARSQPSIQLKTTLDSVLDHISAAAYNAHAHSTIFLLPVWRSMGRFFEWLSGRRLALAVAILGLLGAAGAALVIVPWDYRVDGTGRLMPVTQREVFAPWDGQVFELYVEGGERVEKDQPLIKLNNDELKAELVKVESELQEKQKLLHSLKAQADDAEKNGKTDEKLKAKGKALETQVEIDGAKLQKEILQDRLQKLTVLAPIAGIVTTFQVQQLLENRPVKRGDLLLQVMDEKGDWQLELEIAEHRVGRILKAQKVIGKDLPIEYRLLTSPESSYEATLQSLATRTVTAEEKGSVLEARASLDNSKLPPLAIGADVRARIGCGKSNLGDVLFGDVVEFIQKYLWW